MKAAWTLKDATAPWAGLCVVEVADSQISHESCERIFDICTPCADEMEQSVCVAFEIGSNGYAKSVILIESLNQSPVANTQTELLRVVPINKTQREFIAAAIETAYADEEPAFSGFWMDQEEVRNETRKSV